MPPATDRDARRHVLAIGIDAAEPSLVTAMIERGDLPTLSRLLEDGALGTVHGPAELGSGAVWPTFTTGLEPHEHGIHSILSWDAQAMRTVSAPVDRLRPFWEPLRESGLAVGAVDVPFTAPTRPSSGVEIVEWGTHDWVVRDTSVHPPSLRALLAEAGGSHPFAHRPVHDWMRGGTREQFVAGCLRGLRQRGDLLIALLGRLELDLMVTVFSEVHRASHVLWGTVDPRHPRYDELRAESPDVADGLTAVVRETDRQIGRVIEAAGPAAVLVFSLHGMCAMRGRPTVLASLLEGLGFARRRADPPVTWRQRARRTVATVRRFAPAPARRLYHRVVPPNVTYELARGDEPSLDWSHTTAFALATDQHGWVRINLAGREAQGIVAPGQYEATRDRIERALRAVRTTAGVPLVADVLRMPHAPLDGDTSPLPDLVVHWTDAAESAPLEVAEPPIVSWPQATTMTGQHTAEGCFVACPNEAFGLRSAQRVEASQLHRAVLQALDRTR